MNRIKKYINVRFYSIDANSRFFENFVSNFTTNKNNDSSSRVFNFRSKKYLIKISDVHEISNVKAYSVTVVRERNTWQTKASSDGTITGISLNQGIIGDPYFFFVIPEKSILLGFTTGPSGSLKSVGKTFLSLFKSDRPEQIKLELIPKEKEFNTLKQLPEYSSLHFKINSSSLADVSDDAPNLIRKLSSAPYIENNMQLSLDLPVSDDSEEALSKDSVLEIVNFLSDDDGCTVLKVKGLDSDGSIINLDFANAFLSYKAEILTRHKFIDEATAIEVLGEALSENSSLFPAN